MLVTPGATAYLLTDRLEAMLAIAAGVGLVSAAAGYALAQWLDASVAGAMATVCGVCFALAFLFSPRHGVVSRSVARRRMRRRVAEEDVLLWAGRRLESAAGAPFTARDVSRAQEWLMAEATLVTRRLAARGLLRPAAEGGYALTPAGEDRARDLLRRHRLYESYLDELGYPADHLHAAADRVEHHLSADVTAVIDAETRFPARDPQGKPIPPGS